MSMSNKNYFKGAEVHSRILNKNSNFIIVSYYWGKDNVNNGSVHQLTYGQQVERLISNCKKLKINYYFVRLPNLKKENYQDALGLKPYFIKKCLDKFKQFNCIFMDTDLQILKYPHLFEMDADCWFINWNEGEYACYNPFQLELPGGIIGIGNTFNGRTLLDVLIKYYKPRYAEDKSFSGIFTRNFLNVYTRCVWLPETYLYMFDSHTYVPKKGYTHVASYQEELKNSEIYKKSDLVIVHEDFETGVLDDIYKKRVGRNRYPPTLDKQLGEKLRCLATKFKVYSDWGLTTNQSKHYLVDWKNKKTEDIIKVHKLPSPPQKVKYHILAQRKPKTSDTVTIVSVVDDYVSEIDIDNFIDSCDNKKIPYQVVYSKHANKAFVYYNILKKSKTPVLFVTIDFNLKNAKFFKHQSMDFMAVNLNNEFSLSKCFDPRILKLETTDILYFANNQLTLSFLSLWCKENVSTYVKENIQYKSLEYVFNITNAVNKLRCYWIPSMLLPKQLNKSPKTTKKAKLLTSVLEQCGVKPPLKDYPGPIYIKGSQGKKEKSKVEHFFLQS